MLHTWRIPIQSRLLCSMIFYIFVSFDWDAHSFTTAFDHLGTESQNIPCGSQDEVTFLRPC